MSAAQNVRRTRGKAHQAGGRHRPVSNAVSRPRRHVAACPRTKKTPDSRRKMQTSNVVVGCGCVGGSVNKVHREQHAQQPAPSRRSVVENVLLT
jgi:hypothetical protein